MIASRLRLGVDTVRFRYLYSSNLADTPRSAFGTAVLLVLVVVSAVVTETSRVASFFLKDPANAGFRYISRGKPVQSLYK
jgi:hypothetical protein